MPEDRQTANQLRHVAIIMDGNNRWAKKRGLPGPSGHKVGVERVRDVLKASRKAGVEVLTLFAFSSENWNRPKVEVMALMSLFSTYLKKEAKALQKENVRIRVIGDRTRFSKSLCKQIEEAEAMTRHGAMTIVIAADYGGRWDIVQAAAALAEDVKAGKLESSQISEQLFNRYACLGDLPPTDLCIRTGGEKRISNFLLWQISYAELYFSDELWPDFDGNSLQAAFDDFYQRQRRYGLTGEQLEKGIDPANQKPAIERMFDE
ncbi:MAG: di-trans,poly-cis-decaprenylcistransferase [Pseudomonadales bacterium]|nr:di-trans,poly-cis-decaprenylcistransferase [Pseudomonadales bacterium]